MQVFNTIHAKTCNVLSPVFNIRFNNLVSFEFRVTLATFSKITAWYGKQYANQCLLFDLQQPVQPALVGQVGLTNYPQQALMPYCGVPPQIIFWEKYQLLDP